MRSPRSSSVTGNGDSIFEQLLEAVPDAIVGVDEKGRIALVNSQAEALFGYSRRDLVGETMEKLAPERFRDTHAEQRSSFFAAPSPRPMHGGDVELFGLRRDGSEFPAEISLSAIEVGGETLAIAAIRDISERRRVERKFEQFLEFAPDAVVGVGPGGVIALANHQTEALFGYRRDELIGQKVEILVPDRFRDAHPGHRADYFAEPRTRPMGAGVELFAIRKDGTEFPVEISLSSIETEDGVLATAAVRDISERAESARERALQRQLDRARRLESVGQLAGGIAHDFNNILAVILNYAEFVADEIEADSPAQEDVGEIKRAAERAAALTRQLLIFSRREVAKPEVLYLREVIADLENLLQRALGERIALEAKFGEERLPIEMDPGQLEQVLVNLAVNGRDAMPEGGRLVIEVEAAEIDEEYAAMHPETEPGQYVRLKVSDTGVGMDPETVERVFEPFFTTKDEGTGLGLATVYGIITGAGGRVDVYSEPGVGTTIKIHLPACQKGRAPAVSAEASRPSGSGEVVMVVEDEPDVRRMAERILTRNGYSVIATGRGAEALEICAQPEQAIDLLLTDVIMPEMLGTELVERVKEVRRGIPVIFMSGYSHEVLAPEALADEAGSAFIEKPFNAGELLRAIRGLLDHEGLPDG